MEIAEQILFFTPVYFGTVFSVENNKIQEEVYSIKNKDTGRLVSNVGGWQSKDFNEELITDMKETSMLLSEITVAVNDIYKLWNIDKKAVCTNMWFNVNGHKDHNKSHSHPHSIISAAYYVKCPEKCGEMVFERTDDQPLFFTSSSPNEYTFENYEFNPYEGLLIIFPSYVKHYVNPNMSKEDRISIAFNFS